MNKKSTLNEATRVILALIISAFIIPGLMGQTLHHVSVTNNVFTPKEITIHVGETVRWTNSQGSHNVNGSKNVFPNNPESFGNSVGTDWVFDHEFTVAGTYDYQCDPHVNFDMFGKVIVIETLPDTLTINFNGMTPHVGQTLWIALIDDDSGDVLSRMTHTIEESFSLKLPGIVSGGSYMVEFFADHNMNGSYDSPPTDHAWTLELSDVSGNEVMDFAHNTDFTDIEWDHYAILNLSGMTPHVDQEIYFALVDAVSGEIIDRRSEIVKEEFTVELGELESGKTYHLDFFSDHNSNDIYDAPPADHAWRLEVADFTGDDTLNFTHNTNFTDILWKHRLEINFLGMTPHVGQMLTLYVRDLATGDYLDTIKVTEIEEEFDIESYVIENGSAYLIDFYADHNGNGSYDAPPADHAWRIQTETINGETEIEFTHNTTFTDIFETTGLDADDILKEIYIYPNPVKNTLNINSEEIIEAISIISITGVEEIRLDDLNSNKLSLPVENIYPGYYFIKVTTSNQPTKVISFRKQ